MRLFIIIIFICITSFDASCQQEYSPDSSSANIESDPENMSILRMNTFGSGNLYTPQNNSFPFSLNLIVSPSDLNDKSILYHSLYLTSGIQGDILDYNKNKMFSSFYSFYEQSRPTTMQKVFGMMQLSGAAILAGYHIYKYSIKKKE